MKTKKTPQRKCIICGEHRDKKEFIRIVNNKEEGVSIDETYKKNGRGAYICKKMECLDQAKKNGRLKNALKTNIDNTIYEGIEEIIMNE